MSLKDKFPKDTCQNCGSSDIVTGYDHPEGDLMAACHDCGHKGPAISYLAFKASRRTPQYVPQLPKIEPEDPPPF